MYVANSPMSVSSSWVNRTGEKGREGKGEIYKFLNCLAECSAVIILVNELQHADQCSPDDDWLTEDGVSGVTGLNTRQESQIRTSSALSSLLTSSSTSALNRGSL